MYVLSAQNTHLIERFLLSTFNMLCFWAAQNNRFIERVLLSTQTCVLVEKLVNYVLIRQSHLKACVNFVKHKMLSYLLSYIDLPASC